MKNLCLKSFALILLGLFCVVYAHAQIQVTGVVKDTSGEPIIGASILEKGTTNGTITDFDGNFTLTVGNNAVLEISYVGYVSQSLKAAPNMEVTLREDTEVLDELVVVGYGVQRKSNLTGAISSVKSGDIENRSVADVNQALQGKTAGVMLISSAAPGASSSVRIRGFSSNGSSNPLYVVDGVRVNSISNIDPNDIASMEVLKDAASAAIYGAEAGNGVIMITTKRGSEGSGKITYDFQYSIQSLAKKAEIMNASQYIEYQSLAGSLSQDRINMYWDGKTDTDWADETFESSGASKHNLSFQAGNEKGSVYASLNYMYNDGIIKGDKDRAKRLTGTLNVDYKIKEWLKLTWNNSVAYTSRHAVSEGSEYGTVLRSVLSYDPLTPVSYAPGNIPANMQAILDSGYPLIADENGNYYAISNFNDGDDTNPLLLRDNREDRSWGNSVRGSLALDFTLFKGLTFTSRFGYRNTNYNTYNYTKTWWASAVAYNDDETVYSRVRSGQYYQWENFANYVKSIGNHNITAMAGMSYSEDRNNFAYTGGKGLIKDDISYAYPSYLASSASGLTTQGEETRLRKLSYFGRLSYDYRGTYMAQFTLRADAADLSILPQQKRWGYFPAASVGYQISNEEWFPKNTPITAMKIRGSWGQNGSIAGLSNYAYDNAIDNSSYYNFSATALNYTTGALPSSTGNYNLKWETSEQLDLGFDLRMFKDRFSFSMDYYIKKTKDLIVNGANPTLTIGNTFSPVNAGNVENKGFEFDLSWRDNIDDFSYSISANLATLKNEVTYLDPTIERLSGGVYNRYTITAFEKGYPVWYFRGYKIDHIDSANGTPVYVAADGSLTSTPVAEDQQMIGSCIPDFTYGLTINLSYKNVDLSIFGQGAHGNEIYSGLSKTDRPTTNRLATYLTDAWSSSNTNAKYARVDYAGNYNTDPYWNSSAVIFDGSYFKIKQIQLGYKFPTSLLKKIRISSMRIYAALEDFFTFTSYPGMDPEATTTTSGVASSSPVQNSASYTLNGVDKGNYPSSKKITFGINVSF